MRILFVIVYSAVILLFLLSCSDGSNGGSDDMADPTDVIPTNLVLNVTVIGADDSHPNGDGSGQISVSASATDAVKYGFKVDNGDEQIRNNGVLETTFTAPGLANHIITVIAYSSSNRITTTFKSVSVLVETDGPQLIFSDEFNTDGALDTNKWAYDLGAGGWGNAELQHYTSRPENVIIENGVLKIIARKENYEGAQYTSARIKTQDKFEFTYGTIEVRAKLPVTQGTWPAIWMLGANFPDVGWPRCGEIDIMEQTGNNKNLVLGTCHWFNTTSNGLASYGLDTAVASSTSEFHVYSANWNEDYIRISVDGNTFYEIALNNDLPFDKDFFNILNVAVGGSLGGSVDANFNSDAMEIDYIRIYR